MFCFIPIQIVFVSVIDSIVSPVLPVVHCIIDASIDIGSKILDGVKENKHLPVFHHETESVAASRVISPCKIFEQLSAEERLSGGCVEDVDPHMSGPVCSIRVHPDSVLTILMVNQTILFSFKNPPCF